jgi:cytochrome c oxidase subunit 1
MFAGLTRDLVSVDLAAVGRNHLRLTAATVLLLPAFLPALLGGAERSRAGFDVMAVSLLLVPAGIPSWSGLVLPRLVGAPGLAFGRLHRLSFDLSVAATGLLLASLLVPQGEVDASWHFFMAMDSVAAGPEVEIRAAGVLLVLVSTLLSSVNVLATVAHLRRPGLRWRELDAAFVGAALRGVVAVVSAPVLIA